MEMRCPANTRWPLCSPRYALNIGFNLINKSIFNYFPFPWTVSTVHVVVGAVYCMLAYAVGAKKASFERVRGCLLAPAASHLCACCLS